MASRGFFCSTQEILIRKLPIHCWKFIRFYCFVELYYLLFEIHFVFVIWGIFLLGCILFGGFLDVSERILHGYSADNISM